MDSYRVLVFEKRNRWLSELRRQCQGRQFDERSIEVAGCRTLRDIRSGADSDTRPHLVVLDFDSDPTSCLMFLGQQSSESDRCSTLVLITANSLELEWALRELGADSVLDARNDGSEVTRSCWRLLSDGKKG